MSEAGILAAFKTLGFLPPPSSLPLRHDAGWPVHSIVRSHMQYQSPYEGSVAYAFSGN